MNKNTQLEVNNMRKQPGYTKFTTAILGALALMNSSALMAAPLTVPNTFAPGDPATAATVNANFSATKTAVDDNDGRITTNASDVSTNAAAITGNTTNIGTNTAGVSTNAGNITSNSSSISTNTTSIGTNTTAIAGHETRITALEGGGGGGGTASPVTVNCPSAGAIQAAINGAAPLGRLTITVNGTCSENVVINRNNVTLLGGTAGVISGTTASPTISASQINGLEITSMTIGGGSVAVLVQNDSNLQVTNSTLGGSSTSGSGITALSSTARFIGGASGNTITGGTTSDESPGIEAIANTMIQFVSGSTTVTAGTASAALVAELASTVVAGDLEASPNVTINGTVDFLENSYLGMFNGTITGDMFFANNSTLTLEAVTVDSEAVAANGDIIIDSSSSALIDGDGVTITGNVTVQRSSALSLRGGATISGKLQVRASSGMDADSIVGVIGTLECDTFSGNYLDIFPQSTDVAGVYVVDGGTPVSGDFACGFIFP